jgi:hypothetical protein
VATAKKIPARSTVEREPDVEPMVRLRRTRVTQETTDRVKLFSKEYDDGEVVDFWIPKRRMASLALKYMKMVRTHGDDVAVGWALEKVLGTEAYEDLMEDEQLDEDELAQIFAIVQNAIMGATRDPKE